MKKIYNCIFVLLGLVLASGFLHAQEEILIKKTDWGDFTNIQYSILSDSITNIMADRDDKNVCFVLERNSVYFVASEITNADFHLRIKAQEGEGTHPLIMLKLNDETGDWPNMFTTQNDVSFENIHVSYEHGDKFSQYAHKSNNFGGEGSRISFKGCYMERERQAPIRLAASGMTLLVEDCRLGNVGERTSLDGNGRIFDSRSNGADTVIMRNSTFYNISDRVFRTLGSHIDYLELDHITAFSHLGRHGCINLSTVNEAVIKNWLFMDPQMLGSGRSAMAEEHAKFEGWEHQYFISLDDEPEGVSSVLDIHHNNFTCSLEVQAKWAAIDSLEAPLKMNPLMLEIMGDAAADAFLDPEWVDFARTPAFPYDIIDSVYANYSPDDMNNSYGIYSHDTSVYIQNLDLSYADTYAAYTAGEGGFPLGDLNVFPDQKANWLAGMGPAGFSKVAVIEDNMLQCYPNPFKEACTISYSVNDDALVNISIISMGGQVMNTLVNRVQSPGKYSIRWDGSSYGGGAAAGTYLVVIHSGEKVDATYVVLSK